MRIGDLVTKESEHYQKYWQVENVRLNQVKLLGERLWLSNYGVSLLRAVFNIGDEVINRSGGDNLHSVGKVISISKAYDESNESFYFQYQIEFIMSGKTGVFRGSYLSPYNKFLDSEIDNLEGVLAIENWLVRSTNNC